MFNEINDIKKVLAEVALAHNAFEKLANFQVQIHDGETLSNIAAAKKLVGFAKEHAATIENVLEKLINPATAKEEAAELLAYVQGHQAELKGFLAQAKEIAGEEMSLVTGLIAQFEAAAK